MSIMAQAQTQTQHKQNTSPSRHIINTDKAQDKILKESFSVFKNGSLAFLDEELNSEVEDLLSTEITETSTKKAFADFAFKLKDGRGIHIEWEVDINKEDIKRFASYHIDLDRKHDMPFISIIITAKEPRYKEHTTPSMAFKPKVINLSKRNADETIESIRDKLAKGEAINELEIIYLPLYHSPSGRSIAQLFDTSIKLSTEASGENKQKKDKIKSLLVLLTSKFISKEEMKNVLEANRMNLQNNSAVEIIEGWGFERGAEIAKAETARRLAKKGLATDEIAEAVDMPLAWVEDVLRLEKA